MDPRQLEYKSLKNRDTQFKKDMALPGTDGVLEGFITECGLKFGLPELGAIVYNFGKDR